MAKRFGRNQKRAFREQVSILENKASNLISYSDELHREIKDLHRQIIFNKDTLDHVAKVLGRYFVGLPPNTVEVKEIQEYMSFRNPPDFKEISFSKSFDVRSFVAYTIMNLETSHMQSHRDELGGKVHIIFKTPMGQSGYAIDPNDVKYLNQRDFQNVISEALAHHILTNAPHRKF